MTRVEMLKVETLIEPLRVSASINLRPGDELYVGKDYAPYKLAKHDRLKVERRAMPTVWSLEVKSHGAQPRQITIPVLELKQMIDDGVVGSGYSTLEPHPKAGDVYELLATSAPGGMMRTDRVRLLDVTNGEVAVESLETKQKARMPEDDFLESFGRPNARVGDVWKVDRDFDRAREKKTSRRVTLRRGTFFLMVSSIDFALPNEEIAGVLSPDDPSQFAQYVTTLTMGMSFRVADSKLYLEGGAVVLDRGDEIQIGQIKATNIVVDWVRASGESGTALQTPGWLVGYTTNGGLELLLEGEAAQEAEAPVPTPGMKPPEQVKAAQEAESYTGTKIGQVYRIMNGPLEFGVYPRERDSRGFSKGVRGYAGTMCKVVAYDGEEGIDDSVNPPRATGRYTPIIVMELEGGARGLMGHATWKAYADRGWFQLQEDVAVAPDRAQEVLEAADRDAQQDHIQYTGPDALSLEELDLYRKTFDEIRRNLEWARPVAPPKRRGPARTQEDLADTGNDILTPAVSRTPVGPPSAPAKVWARMSHVRTGALHDGARYRVQHVVPNFNFLKPGEVIELMKASAPGFWSMKHSKGITSMRESAIEHQIAQGNLVEQKTPFEWTLWYVPQNDPPEPIAKSRVSPSIEEVGDDVETILARTISLPPTAREWQISSKGLATPWETAPGRDTFRLRLTPKGWGSFEELDLLSQYLNGGAGDAAAPETAAEPTPAPMHPDNARLEAIIEAAERDAKEPTVTYSGPPDLVDEELQLYREKFDQVRRDEQWSRPLDAPRRKGPKRLLEDLADTGSEQLTPAVSRTPVGPKPSGPGAGPGKLWARLGATTSGTDPDNPRGLPAPEDVDPGAGVDAAYDRYLVRPLRAGDLYIVGGDSSGQWDIFRTKGNGKDVEIGDPVGEMFESLEAALEAARKLGHKGSRIWHIDADRGHWTPMPAAPPVSAKDCPICKMFPAHARKHAMASAWKRCATCSPRRAHDDTLEDAFEAGVHAAEADAESGGATPEGCEYHLGHNDYGPSSEHGRAFRRGYLSVCHKPKAKDCAICKVLPGHARRHATRHRAAVGDRYVLKQPLGGIPAGHEIEVVDENVAIGNAQVPGVRFRANHPKLQGQDPVLAKNLVDRLIAQGILERVPAGSAAAKWSCGHRREPGVPECLVCKAFGRRTTSSVWSRLARHYGEAS